MHKNRVLPQQGWLLAFHPDLLYGTTLEKNNYMSVGAEYTNDRLFLSGTVYGNYFKDKIEGVWRKKTILLMSLQKRLVCQILGLIRLKVTLILKTCTTLKMLP